MGPQESSPYPKQGKTVPCSVSRPWRWSSVKTNIFGGVEGQGAVDLATCLGGTHGGQVITCLSLPACKIGANNARQGTGAGRGSSPIPGALGTTVLLCRGTSTSHTPLSQQLMFLCSPLPQMQLWAESQGFPPSQTYKRVSSLLGEVERLTGEVTSVPCLISCLLGLVGRALQERASSALASVSPFPEDCGEKTQHRLQPGLDLLMWDDNRDELEGRAGGGQAEGSAQGLVVYSASCFNLARAPAHETASLLERIFKKIELRLE